MGEQLPRPIQLRPLYSFPVLCKHHLRLPRLYDNVPGYVLQQRILGNFHPVRPLTSSHYLAHKSNQPPRAGIPYCELRYLRPGATCRRSFQVLIDFSLPSEPFADLITACTTSIAC